MANYTVDEGTLQVKKVYKLSYKTNRMLEEEKKHGMPIEVILASGGQWYIEERFGILHGTAWKWQRRLGITPAIHMPLVHMKCSRSYGGLSVSQEECPEVGCRQMGICGKKFGNGGSVE